MKTFLKTVIPLVVIAAGFIVHSMLVAAAPKTEKKQVSEQGVLVEVVSVAPRDEQVRIFARGAVIPARQVVVSPEVSGRVVWQSPELVPGGRVKKGQALIRVDARDFTLAADQRKASVEAAELELRLEQNRREVAAREWQVIGEESFESEEGRALALREPHVETAKSSLEAAKKAHQQARLAVGKTGLVAPFAAVVQSRQVDVGQLVSPGMQLATLVGTDAFWVEVSVPVERLKSFAVPGLNAMKGEGAPVRVTQNLGESVIERSGKVVRLYGDLDPVGRMARVLVEIEDPFLLQKSDEERLAAGLPMLVGAYVEVEISGAGIAQVVELPRKAIHDGNKVYVYGADDRLEVREVGVAWRREQTVLVSSGLKTGDQVVTSRVGTPIAGMLLRKEATMAAAPTPAPTFAPELPAAPAPAAEGADQRRAETAEPADPSSPATKTR